MSHTLTITAAEWASLTDGTLWLVRGGAPRPPDEFVQACAPCGTRDDTRQLINYALRYTWPCPDCRIELVGPCPTCEVRHRWCGLDGRPRCDAFGTVTLGYGYAIEEPLPIHDRRDRSQYINIDPVGDGSVSVNPSTGIIMLRPRNGALANITAALAHYGDPEWLVGKWALHLEGVTS